MSADPAPERSPSEDSVSHWISLLQSGDPHAVWDATNAAQIEGR